MSSNYAVLILLLNLMYMDWDPFNKINILPLRCKLYRSIILVELEVVTANVIGYFFHIYVTFFLLKKLCKGVWTWVFFVELHI